MGDDQQAGITWRDGVPVSARFGDPYYSLQDGLAEARHVFLAGNDLPRRFRPGFHIAELGFGTGLNMLAAWQAWQAWQENGQGGALLFTSFEAYPLTPREMRDALAAFPEIAPLAEKFLACYAPDRAEYDLPGLSLRIVPGDARRTLPEWDGSANAWFLDGFAPAQNPQMWQEPLLAEVARHTAPGGTFATFTAAGHVRRALDRSGFAVERRPGFGRKRHMTAGVLR